MQGRMFKIVASIQAIYVFRRSMKRKTPRERTANREGKRSGVDGSANLKGGPGNNTSFTRMNGHIR